MLKQKCLGIACSPRKQGNTEMLLKTAIQTLDSLGVETEIIYLSELGYSPCLACEGCYKTGKCVIKDDAGFVFDKIVETDILILAAPIFSMGICAQAKMLIDRAQQFWAAKHLLGRQVIVEKHVREKRRGIFISVAGTNLPGVFDGALRVIRYFFKMVEVRFVGSYCYPSIDKKGEILNHPWVFEEIAEAARELVSPAGEKGSDIFADRNPHHQA